MDYVALLKKHKLKITPQRLAILTYLDTHHTHPTAEEIYSALKTSNPSLSKTTVYNAVETLRSHYIIQTLTISANERRFDIRDDLHHHFLCKRCGKIIDINIDCPNIKRIEQLGYRIDEVHGYFKGICKECLRREDRKT